MEEEKVRLFVGGLPAGVSAGDLKERFTPLGKVLDIALPQAKSGMGHRGFAHVDFLPATDASLRKLFSAYNGCKWRGGCLRIERAKEHYSDRLNREWAIEAASLRSTAEHSSESEDGQEPLKSSERQIGDKWATKSDNLSLFFPKLSKMKIVPMAGLGKHKRSFQRVETSPLHLLFSCACNANSCSGFCATRKTDRENKSSEVDVPQTSSDADESKLGLRDRSAIGMGIEEKDEEKRADSNWNVSSGDTNISPTPKAPTKKNGKASSQKPTEVSALRFLSESLDINAKEDTTKESVARERAQQLELMNRLFPEDAPTVSESIKLVPAEHSNIKKRKRANLRNSIYPPDPSVDDTKPNITDNMETADQHLEPVMKNDEQVQDGNGMHEESRHDRETSPKQNVVLKPGSDNIPLHEKATRDEGDSSILREGEIDRKNLQGSPAVSADKSSDEDSDMILNFGNDSVSLEVAENREKRMVEGIRNVVYDRLQVETRINASSSDATAERIPLTNEVVAKTKEDESSIQLKTTPTVLGDTLMRSHAEDKERTVPINSAVDKRQSGRSRDEGAVHSDGHISKSESRQGQMSSRSKSSKAQAGNPGATTQARSEPSKSQIERAGATPDKQAMHETKPAPNGSAPTLTRSAWKSLVGETGHVVFTLGDLTGSGGGGPPVVSPTRDFPILPDGAQDGNKAKTSSKKKLRPDAQSQNSLGEASNTAAIPSVPAGDVCLFMRSENAEKEWLASKSELRSDYRAKHRHASRTMKKLWGRRGT